MFEPMKRMTRTFLFICYCVLFQEFFHFLKELRDMCPVHKCMIDTQRDRHHQLSLTHDCLSGIHQRISQRTSGCFWGIGNRSKVELWGSTQQNHITVSLFFNRFTYCVRIAIFGNGGDNGMGCFIKSLKIGLIGDTDCIESLSRCSDRSTVSWKTTCPCLSVR